jgi:hypothetical protein
MEEKKSVSFLDKIEGYFNKEMENLSEKPLSTILKWGLVFFVVKKLFGFNKDE